jgi:hypothetical protein
MAEECITQFTIKFTLFTHFQTLKADEPMFIKP